jgi:hypothetical protein
MPDPTSSSGKEPDELTANLKMVVAGALSVTSEGAQPHVKRFLRESPFAARLDNRLHIVRIAFSGQLRAFGNMLGRAQVPPLQPAGWILSPAKPIEKSRNLRGRPKPTCALNLSSLESLS